MDWAVNKQAGTPSSPFLYICINISRYPHMGSWILEYTLIKLFI